MNDFTCIICPHCGHETGIEPALVDPGSPMLYCKECDEPLFGHENSMVPMKIANQVKVLGRMRLNVINPEAPVFSEAIGISDDRKAQLLKEMNDLMERLKGQAVKTCEIISDLVALCDNLEEVVYCTMCHTNYMYSTGNPY